MNLKKIFSTLVIVVVAIIMLTTAVTTAQEVNAAKMKVTWNGNGGKIGTAKTVITNHNKGAKIGKLPKTPKKTGYMFNGWYTKKTGGTKVTTSTKVKTKVTYYAQWKKVLSTSEKSLIGTWFTGSAGERYYEPGTGAFKYQSGIGLQYTFSNDGTYDQVAINDNMFGGRSIIFGKGLWGASGGTIHLTNKMYQISTDRGETWKTPYSLPSSTMKYRLGTDENGQYLKVYRNGSSEGLEYRKS